MELANMSWASIILGFVVILSSLGIILYKKPVHCCLSFLLTLLALAGLYLQLNAPFISAMQVLVYAGAILVIFMFVIVLFQDAHLAIKEYKAKANLIWLTSGALIFLASIALFGYNLHTTKAEKPTIDHGSIEALGKAIYIDFFFPFEAVAMLFLVAIIGALYIGKKGLVHTTGRVSASREGSDDVIFDEGIALAISEEKSALDDPLAGGLNSAGGVNSPEKRHR